MANNKTNLYFDIRSDQLPIVYSQHYDIAFWGMEKLHPFDSKKWGKVYSFLREFGHLTDEKVVQPNEAMPEDLMTVHPKSYLDKLRWSSYVARVTEVPFVALVPNFLVQRKLLKALRYQTGGSVLAGKLALERGWAINIGGGFHHCSSNSGGGFCAYADITLTIKFLFKYFPDQVKKVLIVDLDAHQGNGHERDFKDDSRVYIMDMYNRAIYPGDDQCKGAIDRKIELRPHTKDAEYLDKLQSNLKAALEESRPNIIVYNAGTDVLIRDSLGQLDITDEGIIRRDEIVFQEARQQNIPIVMLTSGGYQQVTARVIANSINNLFNKKLIP